MAKRNLYGNPDHIFITEDLTQLRQGIIKELNVQKKAKKVYSFWTFDGRIFAKKLENSTKSLIKSVDDIHTLIESE